MLIRHTVEEDVYLANRPMGLFGSRCRHEMDLFECRSLLNLVRSFVLEQRHNGRTDNAVIDEAEGTKDGSASRRCEALLFDIAHCGMSIVQLQLIEDVMNVVFDRRDLDMESNSNFFIAQIVLDQSDNLCFTASKIPSIGSLTFFHLACELGHTTKGKARDSRRAESFSLYNGLDTVHQVFD